MNEEFKIGDYVYGEPIIEIHKHTYIDREGTQNYKDISDAEHNLFEVKRDRHGEYVVNYYGIVERPNKRPEQEANE